MLNNVTIKDNKLYNVHAHLIYILWELLNSCSSWNMIWKWQFSLGWKMEGFAWKMIFLPPLFPLVTWLRNLKLRWVIVNDKGRKELIILHNKSGLRLTTYVDRFEVRVSTTYWDCKRIYSPLWTIHFSCTQSIFWTVWKPLSFYFKLLSLTFMSIYFTNIRCIELHKT